MQSIELIGFVAAFLTSASFLPQAIIVIKTRNTDALSLSMYSMFTAGVSLWLAYGIHTKAWPVAIANLVTLVLAATILKIIVENKISQRKFSTKKQTA